MATKLVAVGVSLGMSEWRGVKPDVMAQLPLREDAVPTTTVIVLLIWQRYFSHRFPT
jgi:hypothetical protein